jgi:hypothetical protein
MEFIYTLPDTSRKERSGIRLRAPAPPPRHAKSARAGDPEFAHARKAPQVKPRRSDGTARESVWESRSLPASIRAGLRNQSGSFLLRRGPLRLRCAPLRVSAAGSHSGAGPSFHRDNYTWLPHPCRVLCDRVGILNSERVAARKDQLPHPVPATSAGTRVGQPRREIWNQFRDAWPPRAGGLPTSILQSCTSGLYFPVREIWTARPT